MADRDFEQLVDAHYADLYRFALSLAKNPADACDLTQQAFATFAKKGGELRDPSKSKSWLFTTLYREFLKLSVRSKRMVTMEEGGLDNSPDNSNAGAARSAEQQEMLDALAGLEEPQRAILTLFYMDDCSYKEIAEILDLPLGTVMSRLSRAKEALRGRLQEGRPNGINPASDASDRKNF